MTYRQIASLSVVMVAAFAALPAHSAAPSGSASSADAYGLLVDTVVLPDLASLRYGPVSRAAQDFPSDATERALATLLRAGPLPADGSVVNTVGVMTATASANGVPVSVATAEVHDVALLGGQDPLISADVVRSQSSSGCLAEPDAVGTVFENLRINGVPYETTPAPNTVIDLGVAKVILNEQRPAFDGRGLVVNGIHVVSTTSGDALFRGDVIVSHAVTTVGCVNGATTTGAATDVAIAMEAAPQVAEPDTEVEYTVRVTNTSSEPQLVTQLIDHLAPPLDYVSTSGDFGDEEDRLVMREPAGTDVIVGSGVTIPPGETLAQTFVAKVQGRITPGVYYNNAELLLAGNGNYVTGLGTPVQIVEELSEAVVPAGPAVPAEPDDPSDDDQAARTADLPSTGAPLSLPVFAGAALLAMAWTVRSRTRTTYASATIRTESPARTTPDTDRRS